MIDESRDNEAKRLSVLERLAILDTPEEALYQNAVLIAARICEAPIALVTLVDKHRQWFKAKVGITATETPIELSFCAHCILENSPMLIEDATGDARFECNPMVTGDMHLRFYAGVPLYADSVAVGTLCVAGTEARKLSAGQVEALLALGSMVSSILDKRLTAHELEKQQRELESTLSEAEGLSRELEYASMRFASLFEGLPVACMTVDTDGRVMEWNKRCSDVYGFTPDEALLKPIQDLVVGPSLRDVARKKFAENVRAGGNSEGNEWPLVRKDGTPIWILASSLPLHGKNGDVVGLIYTSVDITERKQAQASLQQSQLMIKLQNEELERANAQLATLATTDGLTGLNNHRVFQDYLEAEFDRAKEQKTELSLILIDVDKFKNFNDRFGHQAGDNVLRDVAEVLALLSGPGTLVARYGGEEFVVVLPGVPELGACEAAERFRHAIEESPWPLQQVTASFGVSTLTELVSSKIELIRAADEALYKSKALGRNCVTVAERTSTAAA